jgi:hypothetical protein
MSAIAWYVGEQKWTDAPKCVCPIIRSLGIWANDVLASDADRERVLGPIMFSLIGTADPDLLLPRHVRVARFACEKARNVLHLVPDGEDRPRLAIEAAERWCDDPSETNAASVGAAAYIAYDASYAASYIAARAAASDSKSGAAAAAANAAYIAAYIAANATYIAAYAATAVANAAAIKRDQPWVAEHEIVPLMLELAAMGERKELPQVRRFEDLPCYAAQGGATPCDD